MTTETPARPDAPRRAGRGSSRVLLRTAAATSTLGLLAAGLGAVLGGRPAALGVLAGLLLTVVVLLGGAMTLDAVASLVPAASLMIALLTYVLQLVALLVVLAGLESSGLLLGTLDRGWLGGTVIGGTMVWLGVQLRTFLTLRVPVYDLDAPDAASGDGEGAHR